MQKFISFLILLFLITLANAQNKSNNTDKKVSNTGSNAMGSGQGDVDVADPNTKDTLKKGGFAVKEQGMPTDKTKTGKGSISVVNPKPESDSTATGGSKGSKDQINDPADEMKNMDKELQKNMMNMSDPDSTFETIDETGKNKTTPQGGKGNNPNPANPTPKTPPKKPK